MTNIQGPESTTFRDRVIERMATSLAKRRSGVDATPWPDERADAEATLDALLKMLCVDISYLERMEP